MCYGIVVPARRPDGPYAASVTLLRARASDERVPLLVDDLRWLATSLSDPLRRATPSA